MTELKEAFAYTAHKHLPELVFSSAFCSHCRADVEIEDGVAYCNNCLLLWDSIEDGAISVFDGDDGEREPCARPSDRGTREAYDHKGRHYEFGPPKPCILPDGHNKDHLHPYDVQVTTINEETS